MTEQHPGDDRLLDLVLGELPVTEAHDLVHHLSTCHPCKREYDALATSVDHILPATPRIEPPPGFERGVLAAMLPPAGSTTSSTTPSGHPDGPEDAVHTEYAGHGGSASRPRRRTLAQLAAACTLGVTLGIGGTLAVDSPDEEAPASVYDASAGTPLATPDGELVGTAALSYLDEQQVLVVTVAGGYGGKTYECRARLDNGETVTLGRWHLPDEGATWVMPAPGASAARIELVTGTDTVWSAADL
ncbi:hypothetical protein EF847_19395 [Actinobacteria bacterium YIM 96077]|uniref:Zinc-finger domain-containing protein n=1 Tax=Phytoactinopolyspora halophila TaxID=1981511 RepID=A0A329QNY1_9ACTN|nr:hypothetical protein [Phytoactinopolyspora halophila]AYY14536.1 hypothetical protein EF847_19395 [Actinobacteria bacterium YIM 96077]RAW14087.1 hypothetical protein DPM12_11740 [Phytoactinopolyspora halophila]